MPDEIETPTAPQTIAVAEPRKQRKPRTPRTAAASAPTEAAVAQKKTRRKRGEAAAIVAATSSASTRGKSGAGAKVPGKRGPRKASAAAPSNAVSGDDFADLMQLETENQKLRKELAEKLRAENADLRKRLGK